MTGVMRFSISLAGAYMHINEFPGHAHGTENFSLLFLYLSRFNGIYTGAGHIIRISSKS